MLRETSNGVTVEQKESQLIRGNTVLAAVRGKVGILRPYKQYLLTLGMRVEREEMGRPSKQVRY